MKKTLLYRLILGCILLSNALTVHAIDARAARPLARTSIISHVNHLSGWIKPFKVPSFEKNKGSWLAFAGLVTLGGIFAYRWWAHRKAGPYKISELASGTGVSSTTKKSKGKKLSEKAPKKKKLDQPKKLPWFDNICYITSLVQALYATTFPDAIAQRAKNCPEDGTSTEDVDQKRTQELTHALNDFFEAYKDPKEVKMHSAIKKLYTYLKGNQFIERPDKFNDIVSVWERINGVLSNGWKKCGLANPFTIRDSSNNRFFYLALRGETTGVNEGLISYTKPTVIPLKGNPYVLTKSITKSPSILMIVCPLAPNPAGKGPTIHLKNYTFPLEISNADYLPKGDHYKLTSIVLYTPAQADFVACVRWGSTWWWCDSLHNIITQMSPEEITGLSTNGSINKLSDRNIGHYTPRFFLYERVAPETQEVTDVQKPLTELSQQLNTLASLAKQPAL